MVKVFKQRVHYLPSIDFSLLTGLLSLLKDLCLLLDTKMCEKLEAYVALLEEIPVSQSECQNFILKEVFLRGQVLLRNWTRKSLQYWLHEQDGRLLAANVQNCKN